MTRSALPSSSRCFCFFPLLWLGNLSFHHPHRPTMSRRGAPPSFASKGMFDVLSAEDDAHDDDEDQQHDEEDVQVSESKSQQ
jgi:hypothetical protein